jgi:hypothetical protein
MLAVTVALNGAVAVPVLILAFWALYATLRWRAKANEVDWWVQASRHDANEIIRLTQQWPDWDWHLDPSLDGERDKREPDPWDNLWGSGDPLDYIEH